MFTPIDKNLLIAAMESAIFHACKQANIVSLHAIETGVSALRQRFDANPESVTDADVFGMVETIERAAIPPLATIDAINNDTNIADRVVSYLWRNIVDKPTTFPPAEHAHKWSEVSYKPITYPPTAHQHVKADVSDFPATMPPTAHAHVKADVSDFPATLPPTAHAHVKADISDLSNMQPLVLSVCFAGSLSAGMAHSLILPHGLQQADLRSITVAAMNTGTAGTTTFDVAVWNGDYTQTWIESFGEYKPLELPAGTLGGNAIDVPALIAAGQMTHPKVIGIFEARDWLRLKIASAASGATDAYVLLHFQAQW